MKEQSSLRIIGLLAIIALLSCKSFSQSTNPTDKNVEIYNRIFLADSLLTKEELKLKYITGDLITKNMYVDENSICTRLKEDDFVKNNIPLYYYYVLIRDIKNANAFMKNNKITIDSISKLMTKANSLYSKNRPKL